MTKNLALFAAAAVLILSACSPAAASNVDAMAKPTEAMMEKPTEEMMDKPAEAMTETPADAMGDKMMESPAWFGVPLTNVKTGEQFMVSDFKGKVVLVESLAMWCPSCKKQQQQVKLLNEQLGMPSDLVLIGLDVDPNEVGSDLKTYAESNGFDWDYTVAPQEVLRDFSSLYGDQFLNPPSTPILIIDRKGEVHPMPFGIKSADDLKKFIDPFLAGAM